MINKRLWLGVLAIPVVFTVLVFMGADRPQHPASAGGDPLCTSSSPCLEWDNNSTGPGVRGVSSKGNGLAGWTDFNSTSSSNGTAGLIGADKSASGTFDSGVRGVSVRGIGVAGQSTSNAGVQGNSTNNNGVFGDSQSSFASGVYGQNDGGGYGLAGRVTKSGFPAVLADAGSTRNDALDAFSQTGVGLFAVIGPLAEDYVPDATAALAVKDITTTGEFAVHASSSNGTALDGVSFGSHDTLVLAQGVSATGRLISAASPAGTTVMYLDDVGNMHAHSFTADLAATTGQNILTYAPQASQPTIEDFGEAQLTNGSAYVRIEPRFESTMERGVNYLVFLTPEGDSRGLYVTQKSAAGFVVRENQGGHSTLAFSYRIVAKPFGNESPRLPHYVTRKQPLQVRMKS